ncbi:MAG: hypothetical protein ACTSYR_03890 [Candidatus Odinarchaeia archaeon]
MTIFKVYLKKSNHSGSMDKLWDVQQIEASDETELDNKIGKLLKKGWKVFKINKLS